MAAKKKRRAGLEWVYRTSGDHVVRLGPFVVNLWRLGARPELEFGRRAFPYQLGDLEGDPKKPVFQGTDLTLGTRMTFDRAVVELLGFLSLDEGDTDDEFFDSYTPRQIAWRDARAQDLSMDAGWFEERLETLEERRERRPEEPGKQDWIPRAPHGEKPPPMAGARMGGGAALERTLKPTLYIDLDNTLLYAVLEGFPGHETVKGVVIRPGAQAFLERLSRHGDLSLLTLATGEYAVWAVGQLGPAGGLFRRMLFKEDLDRVETELEFLYRGHPPGTPQWAGRLKAVRPIAPPGIVFDDAPPGDPRYYVKTAAVGVGREAYIQVPPFSREMPDAGGLEKAYREYLARFEKGVAPAGARVL